MKKIYAALAFFILCIAYVAASEMSYQDARGDEPMYCEMNKIRIDSKGEYGWPDFNQNYEEVCK